MSFNDCMRRVFRSLQITGRKFVPLLVKTFPERVLKWTASKCFFVLCLAEKKEEQSTHLQLEEQQDWWKNYQANCYQPENKLNAELWNKSFQLQTLWKAAYRVSSFILLIVIAVGFFLSYRHLVGRVDLKEMENFEPQFEHSSRRAALS